MKKIFSWAVAALLFSLCAQAQETYRYAVKDTCALYLDIFRPDSNAQTTFKDIVKPAIMYVFGGGFVSGSRSDPAARGWFRRLTANGYTVVAIDYRLGMKGYRMQRSLRGAMKALDRFVLSQQMGVDDVFSAVAFLAAHPELGVPVDNLVISGSSAGAIISLAAAYAVANGDARGVPADFAFKGVMSFAGGFISKSGPPKFRKAPCPLLLFHGTADRIVAYKHFGLRRRGIWGSSYIASHLLSDKGNCSIWRFHDQGHEVAAYVGLMWDKERAFLEKNVMQGIPCTTDALISDPSLPTWNSNRKATAADLYQ